MAWTPLERAQASVKAMHWLFGPKEWLGVEPRAMQKDLALARATAEGTSRALATVPRQRYSTVMHWSSVAWCKDEPPA